MPRAPRRNHDGAIHHVIVKGCHGHRIVLDDRDRRTLLSLVADACELFAWRVLTYCLLGNHLHLVLRTPRSGLSDGMHRVCSAYARYFRPRQHHAGSTFQRPFKSYLVGDERYLVAVTRYVAFNPVRHGLCADPCAWWPTAHPILLGHRPPDLIDVSGMFEVLDGRDHYARLFEHLDAGPTKARDRAIVHDARCGYAVSQIVARLDVSDATVRRVLECHAVPTLRLRGDVPNPHNRR